MWDWWLNIIMKLFEPEDALKVIDIDCGIRNPWKLSWLTSEIKLVFKSETHTYTYTLSDFFNKTNLVGKAWCVICPQDIAYASKGNIALKNCCIRICHIKSLQMVISTASISSMMDLGAPTKPTPTNNIRRWADMLNWLE